MGFFATTVETREVHKREDLRTRYYRNNFTQVEKALRGICDADGMQMQQVNKRYGDIYMIADGYEIFATVLQITPIETAVDLKVNYFATLGLNRPEKKVKHIYAELDKALSFKGTMLHL